MKKMFAASLVAIMAVSAANAEIASVSYTNKAITTATGDLDTLATTAKTNLTAAVNELAGKVGTQDVGAQISTALESAKDYTDELANGAVATNTAAIAALDNTYATDTALSDSLALKQDKSAMATDMTAEVSAAKDSYYPSVGFMETRISTANNDVMDMIDANTDGVADYIAADTALESSLKTYADQAETDAIAAAGTAADDKIAAALGDYSTTTEMNTAIKDANDAQTTAITTAYEAADAQTLASAKTYADEKAAAATGSATAVSEALEAYKTSNDAEVAAAKSAADAAQATADANAEAIEGLDSTYVKDSDFSTFQTSNTTAIDTAKTEAIAAAKTAGDAAYDTKGAAAAAQTAAVDAAKQAADATYQVKSSALSVGAAGGTWTDLTTVTGYSAAGTHSLVLKDGKIQWEAVRYAE